MRQFLNEDCRRSKDLIYRELNSLHRKLYWLFKSHKFKGVLDSKVLKKELHLLQEFEMCPSKASPLVYSINVYTQTNNMPVGTEFLSFWLFHRHISSHLENVKAKLGYLTIHQNYTTRNIFWQWNYL